MTVVGPRAYLVLVAHVSRSQYVARIHTELRSVPIAAVCGSVHTWLDGLPESFTRMCIGMGSGNRDWNTRRLFVALAKPMLSLSYETSNRPNRKAETRHYQRSSRVHAGVAVLPEVRLVSPMRQHGPPHKFNNNNCSPTSHHHARAHAVGRTNAPANKSSS